jgi:superfamily II DNA/RNA helicase
MCDWGCIAERREQLQAFQENADLTWPLLVCTDSAARGLDIAAVGHVIQAEFALNVVQHVHRIGRASRAGRAVSPLLSII